MTEDTQWINAFPGLSDLGAPAMERMRAAPIATAPAGHRLFAAGEICENFYLVIDGRARVLLSAESGRDATLYTVGAGETCLMTLCGLLSGERYAAEAWVDTDMRAAVLDRPGFFTLFDLDPAFRRFALNALGGRLSAVMVSLGEIAFGGLDRRLAHALIEAAGEDGVAARTHAALASELGAARESVSRRLKLMEQWGWVKRERGGVALADRAALRRCAEEEDR